MSEWLDPVLAWCEAHQALLYGLGGASLAMLVVSALLTPVFVGMLPPDEFKRRKAPPHRWRELHPAAAPVLRVVRNLLGATAVLAGLAMLILPGQGLLTIFVGILLLEFPGKRRLVLCIVSKRPVRRALNWLRRRRGVPEFEFEEA